MSTVSGYPDWLSWQSAIESQVKSALSKSGVEDFTMTGATTNMAPVIKSQDDLQARQPYAEVLLSNVTDGHDNQQSNQPSWNHFANSTAGNKFLKSRTGWLETLQFQINVYASRYDHLIKMMQSLKRHLQPVNKLTTRYKGRSFSADTFLKDYTIGRENLDATGANENFVGTWIIDIRTETDSGASSTMIPAISETVLSSSLSSSIT